MHNSLSLALQIFETFNFEFCWLWIFLESNFRDILPVFETNLDDSIDSGHFSVRGYLPLIWKDSTTHMHGLPIQKDFFLHRTYLWKTLQIFAYVFDWLYITQFLTFFLHGSPYLSFCMAFDSVSSTIDEVLLINLFANVFVRL